MKKRLYVIISILISISIFNGCVSGYLIENAEEIIFGDDYNEYDITADYNDTYYSIGDLREIDEIENIVILVDVDGSGFYDDEVLQRVDLAYNSVDESDEVISLKEYIQTVSYGIKTVNSTTLPIKNNKIVPYRIKNDSDYYKKFSLSNMKGYKNQSELASREEELIVEILNNVQNQIPEDIDIDKNEDGVIDIISFVFNIELYSFDSEIEHNGIFWPHMSEAWFDAELDGAKLGVYNILSTESKDEGMFGTEMWTGTIIHEFLHALDLPDLYRYNDDGSPVSIYDIMSDTCDTTPQRLNAYLQREYLNWGEHLKEIRTSTENVTINVAEYKDKNEPIAVKILTPYSEEEFFVVEYRKAEGLDKEISMDGDGIIIYRVNENIAIEVNGLLYSDGNAESIRYDDYIYVFRPGEVRRNEGKGKIEEATLSLENNRTSFGKEIRKEKKEFDDEVLYYSDGKNSGIVISNVGSSSGDSISFDITISTSN